MKHRTTKKRRSLWNQSQKRKGYWPSWDIFGQRVDEEIELGSQSEEVILPLPIQGFCILEPVPQVSKPLLQPLLILPVSWNMLHSQQKHTPKSATAHSKVSNSTLYSQQQPTPQSATAHSKVSNSLLYSQQQHTPKSATAHSTVSNSTLQSQQQPTLQSATAHSNVSNSTLYCQQQHTPKSATAHSTVSNSTELYS